MHYSVGQPCPRRSTASSCSPGNSQLPQSSTVSCPCPTGSGVVLAHHKQLPDSRLNTPAMLLRCQRAITVAPTGSRGGGVPRGPRGSVSAILAIQLLSAHCRASGGTRGTARLLEILLARVSQKGTEFDGKRRFGMPFQSQDVHTV